MLTADRLNTAISTARDRVDALPQDRVEHLQEVNKIDFEEHFKFQSLQAEAHVSGIMSPDAAQIIYNALGATYSDTNGGWATNDLATKCIITQLMAELLERKMKVVR